MATETQNKGSEMAPARVLSGQSGRSLLALSADVLLLWAVMMSVYPALPRIAAAIGVSAGTLGLVFAGSAVLMTALGIPAGVLSDRYGRRPLVLAGLAVSAIGVAVAAASALSAGVFIAGWIVFGVGRGLFLSPAFTVPADLYPPQQRGQAIGYLAGAIGIGSVIGYVGGGLVLAVGGWRTILVVDVVLVALPALATGLVMRESNHNRLPSTLPKATAATFGWFRYRVVLQSGIVAGLAFAIGVAATFLVPFSLTTLHVSALLIAGVFVPYEVVASVGTMITGKVSDKAGRKPPMLASVGVLVVALAALPLLGVSAWSIAVLYAFVGLAEGPVVSLATAMVTDEAIRIDPRRIGAALGASRLVVGIGPIVGPIAGGLLVQHAATGTRFWILAAAAAVTFALGLMLRETHTPQGAS
jgi:MFS family permease